VASLLVDVANGQYYGAADNISEPSFLFIAAVAAGLNYALSRIDGAPGVQPMALGVGNPGRVSNFANYPDHRATNFSQGLKAATESLKNIPFT
jgi:hypothetical protein